ncbi:hypothetical protein SAMN05421766_10752 [Zobellia uliginosa]|uniref:Uncharacterized protein n=1 Tax=Zobellia uliginosa TaxID=143224 RepID=A0ABY1L4C5_9FLAO|nr:hypothetical protein SAMN05421766_10752 [Zobellia uliginosa]
MLEYVATSNIKKDYRWPFVFNTKDEQGSV